MTTIQNLTAYKYRLYPTPEQELFFAKTFGCCRKLWNLMLFDRNEYYKIHHTALYNTPAQYKTSYPFLKEVDSLALANVQLQLNEAFKRFFKDPHTGHPKFKKKHHKKQSYTTNNQKGSIAVLDGYVKLPKIKKVKAVIHRPIPTEYTIKSATISKESSGRYYVSILCSYTTEVIEHTVDPKNTIGLDYKSNGLYMDSSGTSCNMPHYYRAAQKKLAKAQRKLRHKKVHSNNYQKQQVKVAKIHQHIANQRSDYLHKRSAEIANQYDAVFVETLNLRAMSNHGFGNGKATMDNGYSMFVTMLDYKLTRQGKSLVKVDKWYPSSQLCHICGFKQKLELNERVYNCPCCGLSIDRDYNAALNIKSEGLRMLSLTAE